MCFSAVSGSDWHPFSDSFSHQELANFLRGFVWNHWWWPDYRTQLTPPSCSSGVGCRLVAWTVSRRFPDGFNVETGALSRCSAVFCFVMHVLGYTPNLLVLCKSVGPILNIFHTFKFEQNSWSSWTSGQQVKISLRHTCVEDQENEWKIGRLHVCLQNLFSNTSYKCKQSIVIVDYWMANRRQIHATTTACNMSTLKGGTYCNTLARRLLAIGIARALQEVLQALYLWQEVLQALCTVTRCWWCNIKVLAPAYIYIYVYGGLETRLIYIHM